MPATILMLPRCFEPLRVVDASEPFGDILAKHVGFSFTAGADVQLTGRANVVSNLDGLVGKLSAPKLVLSATSFSRTTDGYLLATGTWRSPNLRMGTGSFMITFNPPDRTDAGSQCATTFCLRHIVLAHA